MRSREILKVANKSKFFLDLKQAFTDCE